MSTSLTPDQIKGVAYERAAEHAAKFFGPLWAWDNKGVEANDRYAAGFIDGYSEAVKDAQAPSPARKLADGAYCKGCGAHLCKCKNR